jgi:hypothetical protein
MSLRLSRDEWARGAASPVRDPGSVMGSGHGAPGTQDTGADPVPGECSTGPVPRPLVYTLSYIVAGPGS